MFIQNQNFHTDGLVAVTDIRYLLFTNFYNNPVYLESLRNIIAKHIDCLSLDYDPIKYTFIIKIKKTSMKKLNGFSHESNFYHNIIGQIFFEFIETHKQDVIRVLSTKYQDPMAVLDRIYNTSIMANLCLVSCLADNIICLKL